MTAKRKAPPHAWKKGQSGNPAGKPVGSRNKATLMVLGIMEKGAEEIAQVVVEAAKRGDLAAARLVIERLAPPVRERPISLNLPETGTIDAINAAQTEILQAVAAGDLLPGEGASLAGIAELRRKALETEELEKRITNLETKLIARNNF